MAKNPEATLRKQETQLEKLLEQDILGPSRSEQFSESTFPSEMDPEAVSMDSGDSYEEIFPQAGDFRSDVNVEELSDFLNLLSANPRSEGDGYIDRAGFLHAVDESIDPRMVLGLKDSTYETLVSEFDEQGLIRTEDELEVTSIGYEVMGAMSPLVQDFDDYEEASQIFAGIAGRKTNCSDRMLEFFYTMETEDSLTDITENLEANRRAAAHRYQNWRDDLGLFTGMPDERRRTPKGEKTYQTVSTMAHWLNRVSDTDYFTSGSEF